MKGAWNPAWRKIVDYDRCVVVSAIINIQKIFAF